MEPKSPLLVARRARLPASARPVRVERLVVTRERRAWYGTAALVSLALHGLVGVPVVVGMAWPWGGAPADPPVYATIEMVEQQTPTVGNGPSSTGHGQDVQPSAAAPPPSPQVAPQVAPKVATQVPPDPAPKSSEHSAAPAPPEAAQAAPPAPPAPSVDTPRDQASEPPDIRLSDSDSGTGLVTGDQVIPAGLDSKVHNMPPSYPAEASRYGEQGTVMLSVLVGPDGSAREVEISETSGYDRLDRAAREAVSHWHFRPAEQGGIAVESVFPVRVRFTLKNS